MILAVDIGNTNINIGSFAGKKLVSNFCIDNITLINQKAALPGKSHLLNESKNIVVASVNPNIESVFYKSLAKKHKKKIFLLIHYSQKKVLLDHIDIHDYTI